jgi:hypothetical protein
MVWVGVLSMGGVNVVDNFFFFYRITFSGETD